MSGLKLVERHVRIGMMLHVVWHLPGELPVEPPSSRSPGANPGIGLCIRTHCAGSVLRKLVHAEVPSTQAVWQQPEEEKLQAHPFRKDQRQHCQDCISCKIRCRLPSHSTLCCFGLVRDPWVYLSARRHVPHSAHPLKAKGIATEELSITDGRFCWIIEIHTLAAQLGVLCRVIGVAVVRPMEAPKPFRSSEDQEAKRMGQNGVQGLGRKCSIVHHFMKSVEEERLCHSKGYLSQKQ
mmetsp:Transcript_15174/g.26547  ORF Transcript_15174/g.26547 Transcript_15174/m.26547 type:complete len:237 (+) Transcript_15174:213-923(+)